MSSSAEEAHATAAGAEAGLPEAAGAEAGLPVVAGAVAAEGFQGVAAAAGVEVRAEDGEIMRDFLTTEEEQAVVDAIRAAESQTSGEIRVVITSRWILLLERHAGRLFDRLGMARTRLRNGALIVLFSRRRRFVVLGDSGLNETVEPGYWNAIAAKMTGLLSEGRKVDALAAAIRMIGETMADHWPPEVSNPDELPNSIHRE
jgi:uncharacterized membrane protein